MSEPTVEEIRRKFERYGFSGVGDPSIRVLLAEVDRLRSEAEIREGPCAHQIAYEELESRLAEASDALAMVRPHINEPEFDAVCEKIDAYLRQRMEVE